MSVFTVYTEDEEIKPSFSAAVLKAEEPRLVLSAGSDSNNHAQVLRSNKQKETLKSSSCQNQLCPQHTPPSSHYSSSSCPCLHLFLLLRLLPFFFFFTRTEETEVEEQGRSLLPNEPQTGLRKRLTRG